MKVCIITLGCKVNQYESNQIAAQYVAAGDTVITKFTPDADLYIINTCKVTNFAEKKSRYQVARIRRENPHAQLVVGGCAGDRNITKSLSCHALQPRKRAFIKVQDGCNNFCSYCIVPHVRGRSTSRPIPDIITEIKKANKPTVLTGIDLSDFTNLPELCKAVNACNLPFELSSIETRIITPGFLRVLEKCANFTPKFHVPLQSASDKVLRDMNRKYTGEEYRKKIELIREFFPKAIISTDVIIGFPTETEQDFMETYDFVREMNFSKVHVFPYSKRDGTQAAKYKELQPAVISKRLEKLKTVPIDIQ